MLNQLGFPQRQKKFLRKRAAKIALRSSFFIWTNHFSSLWQPPNIVPHPSTCYFPPSAQPAPLTANTIPLYTSSPSPPPILPPTEPTSKSSSLTDAFNAISAEISLYRNRRSAPPHPPSTNSPTNLSPLKPSPPLPPSSSQCTAVFSTPARLTLNDSVHSSPLPTLTNLRRQLDNSTPLDVQRWSHFGSWSSPDQKCVS